MTLYETIFQFIMTYILPGNNNEGGNFFDWIDYLGIFNFVSGTDGRMVWAPMVTGGGWEWSYAMYPLGHILTIVIISSFVFGLFRLLASIFRIGRR